jgi:hypothetical protein
MNKLLLFTLIFAVSYNAAWAQSTTTALEIREHTGALVQCADALLSSITTNPTDATNNAGLASLATTSSGSGSGAVLTVVISGGAVTGVTVTTAGKGYEAGDTLTVANAGIAGTSTDLVITLLEDDISNGGLKCGDIKGSIASGPSDAKAQTKIVSLTTQTGTGSGAKIEIKIGTNGDAVGAWTSVTVVEPGTGYSIGDVLKVLATADELDDSGSNGLVDAITLFNALTGANLDADGAVRIHPDGTTVTSNGATKAFTTSTFSGYFLPLQKSTNSISVRATFTGPVTPSIGSVSDTTLVTLKVSKLLPLTDGANTLKIASTEGTYEILLVKPDDNIKAVQVSKRSIGIAYNPAAVGEFTCAAFVNGVTGGDIPETRAEVTASSTDSNIIAKSVRTHNIVPEDIFKTVQMTLNGLTPFTAYDLYCYHSSHGIISNTDDAYTTTDKASLTSVGVIASDRNLAWTDGGTIKLTFTHEGPLVGGSTIELSLYTNFNSKQAFADGDTTVGDCSAQVAIKSNTANIDLTGLACVDGNTDDLLITLGGTASTIHSAAGSVLEVTLTHDADGTLRFANNAAAGAKVTFNLDVAGHGILQQQPGWDTN